MKQQQQNEFPNRIIEQHRQSHSHHNTKNKIRIDKCQKNVKIEDFKGVSRLEMKASIPAKHYDDAFCLCVLDNNYLAIGSSDATITIYDLRKNCKLIRKINYFYEPILVLEAFHMPSKSLLLSSGYDQIVNVWNYREGKKVIQLEACGSELTKICDNLDCNHFIGSTYDGRIVVWSIQQKCIVEVIRLQSKLDCSHLAVQEKKQKNIEQRSTQQNQENQELLLSETQEESSQHRIITENVQSENSNTMNNSQEITQIEEEEEYLHSDMNLEDYGCVYSMLVIKTNHFVVLQRGCISELSMVVSQEQYSRPKLQVIREFPANPDAVQFNIIPYEKQRIIVLGTSRGFVNLFDFDTGERVANNFTLNGAINEILTIQNTEPEKDNIPIIFTTCHNENVLRVDNLKTGESIAIQDQHIFCYNECMNSKMQFFKNYKNELFIVCISQEHLKPFFSIIQVHTQLGSKAAQKDVQNIIYNDINGQNSNGSIKNNNNH